MIPNEHASPKVLVRTVGGLSAVAARVANHINRAKGDSFCDTDVGSGAIFCRLREFKKVKLCSGDWRLLELYKDIKNDHAKILGSFEGVVPTKLLFDNYRTLDYDPSREFYLRTMGYKGWWCGEHSRIRKGEREHIAAWRHALTMLPTVSYMLRNCEFGTEPEGDIILGHDVGKFNFILMKGYDGEGTICEGFDNGLALWRLDLDIKGN